MKTFMRRLHIKRILIITVLAAVCGLTALLVTLAFLPAIVGSQAVQARIKQALSTSLKRQVTWSNLVVTRSGGMTLTGFNLGDGSAPLLKTDIGQIVVIPSAVRGADGRFGIDLAVRVRNVRAELAPGPEEPRKPAKDPLTLVAEYIQRIQELDFPLPVDLRVTAEVAPLNVVFHAPAPMKPLRLQDFSLHFAMPSLATKPITTELNGRLFIDVRDIGKVSCSSKISNLVTKEQRIRLASALFAVDASAPGTNITLSGGLSQADGFTAQGKLDLPALLAVAHPFIPPEIPKLAGNIEFLLRAKSDADRDIHATLSINGARLAASGGVLKSGRLGPLDLKLQQRIVTDHVRQRVDFSGGTLAVPGLIDVAWSAQVNRPTIPERSLELHFGPLKLDLARSLSLAAPLLPPNAQVKDIVGEATLRSLTLHLNGPGNRGDLAVAGFDVKLPHVRLALNKVDLTAEDIHLLVEKAGCPLSAALPTSLTADLLWSVQRVALSGAQPLTIQGVGGKAGVAVTELNLKSASPRKVVASATITQTFDLDRASLGTEVTIEKVHGQHRILARAAESGDIEATVPEFAVSVASLQSTQAGKRVGPIPLVSSLTATGLRLLAGNGGRLSLQHVAAVVSLGDFLRLTADSALSGESPQRVTTLGAARLDLRRLMPFAAPFLPSGVKGDGVVDAVWDLVAPLPEQAFAAGKNPLTAVRAGLSLFDKFDLGVKLDNISATLPSAVGTISVTGVRTGQGMHIVATKKGESARFDGEVLFSAVSGFSGPYGELPAQHGTLTFNGDLSGWRELRLNEELRLAPLAVSHEAELNVSRIDKLLDEKQPFSTATLIKRLDATLFANVEGVFSREMKQLLPGIDLSGNVSGNVRVDLTAGRELALRGALKTRDLGIQLADGTNVEGVRSDIVINRTYALAAAQGESWMPLSAALVRPSAAIAANAGAVEIVGRIHDDLRGDVRGARSFSVRRISTKAAGVPLEITALEGDLLFTQEKSGISFLQADLLGGTLLAQGLLDLRPDIPNIAAGGSFSNLDVSLLLPKETRKLQGNQDAEISGEISLTAPLTFEQRELFEQLRLAVNVRKIGANTMERALFSLDPYERNEQVVAQRKMLRLGVLKGLRATAVDGAFSMEGEAMVKGFAIDLPKVERLRISELPLRQELVKNKEKIMALRTVLDLVRADTLVVGPNGELSLKRRMYAQ